MDTVLMLVTALSLSMAIGMAFVVARLLREERMRSEARIAALGAMSADAGDPERTRRLHPPPSLPVSRHVRPAPIDDLEIRPSEPAVAGVGDLFTEQNQPSPWGRRFAVIGTLAAAILAIGFVVLSSGSGDPAPAAPAAVPKAAVTEIAPLELLSLRHTQRAQSLTVTGLVQNPREGAPLSRVVATAFVFGPDGAFLSSSRAPLDFTTLAPGDESPFVVTVPVTGEVSRYRIGFRAEDGHVIAHVDKRSPDALVTAVR